jgi:hypothetical protein
MKEKIGTIKTQIIHHHSLVKLTISDEIYQYDKTNIC